MLSAPNVSIPYYPQNRQVRSETIIWVERHLVSGSPWENNRKEVRAERWRRMGGEEGRQAPERKKMRSRMVRKDTKTWVRATYVFERVQTWC